LGSDPQKDWQRILVCGLLATIICATISGFFYVHSAASSLEALKSSAANPSALTTTAVSAEKMDMVATLQLYKDRAEAHARILGTLPTVRDEISTSTATGTPAAR